MRSVYQLPCRTGRVSNGVEARNVAPRKLLTAVKFLRQLHSRQAGNVLHNIAHLEQQCNSSYGNPSRDTTLLVN